MLKINRLERKFQRQKIVFFCSGMVLEHTGEIKLIPTKKTINLTKLNLFS